MLTHKANAESTGAEAESSPCGLVSDTDGGPRCSRVDRSTLFLGHTDTLFNYRSRSGKVKLDLTVLNWKIRRQPRQWDDHSLCLW